MVRLIIQLTGMLESQEAAQLQSQQQAYHQGQALLTAIQQQSQDRGLAGPQAAAGSGVRRVPHRVELPRMVEADDAEAYLAKFEGTMRAARIPEEEWAQRLLPLLTGRASWPLMACP